MNFIYHFYIFLKGTIMLILWLVDVTNYFLKIFTITLICNVYKIIFQKKYNLLGN